ncbi:MAG TPA: hypothetical protein VI790_05115 [Candidatus Nanoarchaeia archaeon]|nr:hypothetical protein [Candidatus Nanoarchaeia archaeon]
MSFLGTRSLLFADLSLIIQIIGFVILCIAVVYAKKKVFKKHFLMTRITVLLAVVAVIWMVSSLVTNAPVISINLSELPNLLTVIHAILGVIALTAGILLAFDKFITKSRSHMIIMFLLWMTVLILGILVYFMYYV